MRKYFVLIFVLAVLIGGCATKQLLVDKTDGISKGESKILAVQYMGGIEPCGYRENYDCWRWDFRVQKPGYEATQTHVYVNKITGNVATGIK